jgi:transposase
MREPVLPRRGTQEYPRSDVAGICKDPERQPIADIDLAPVQIRGKMPGIEATIFTGWIYDHLLPHAESVKVAHPLMLRAIAAAKKKNDRSDAAKIADCLRCDFLPECHMAPTAIRDRRRVLRYRNLVQRQAVQMKNRISGLLMEAGVPYDKLRLHRMGYFRQLMSSQEEITGASGRC